MESRTLILAADGDPHVDAVCRSLEKLHVVPLHLNRARLTSQSVIANRREFVVDGIDFRKVGSIWNRRQPQLILPVDVEPRWQGWCSQEFGQLFLGALMSTSAIWINDPMATKRANHKLLQLDMASSIAVLNTPDYLVTSDAAAAREFVFGECRGLAVMKPLGRPVVGTGTELSVIFTNDASKLDDDDWSGLHLSPSIFQRRIAAKAEIRVTIVRDRVFATRIDTSDYNDVDYRRLDPYSLEHSVIRLSPDIESACLSLCDKLGLIYAAIDLLEDQAGEFHFLEINPSGQWLWIEELTGHPIAESIAETLVASLQHSRGYGGQDRLFA